MAAVFWTCSVVYPNRVLSKMEREQTHSFNLWSLLRIIVLRMFAVCIMLAFGRTTKHAAIKICTKTIIHTKISKQQGQSHIVGPPCPDTTKTPHFPKLWPGLGASALKGFSTKPNSPCPILGCRFLNWLCMLTRLAENLSGCLPICISEGGCPDTRFDSEFDYLPKPSLCQL